MRKPRHGLWVAAAAVLALSVALLVWRRDGEAAAPPPRATQPAPRTQQEMVARLRQYQGEALELAVAPKGQTVSGVVRSASGAPLDNAIVCASCTRCDMTLPGNRPVCLHSGTDGAYQFDGLPEGNYFVTVGHDGHAPVVANGGLPVSIGKQGAPVSDLDAELDEGGAVLSGSVTDATGGPVAGATVQASAEFGVAEAMVQVTTSDDSGRFALSVPPGAVRVLAIADGYASADVSRHAPASDVRLVMTPPASISGTVTTLEGQPVSGVEVIARGVQPGSSDRAVTSSEGQFVLSTVRPGAYQLTAQGPGFRGEYPGTVTVDLLQSVSGLVIAVDPAREVRGTLRVGERPCEPGEVYLYPGDGADLPRLYARANHDASVVFNAVPSGRYQSTSRCGDFGFTPGPNIEVRGTDVVGVEWQVNPGVDLSVRAVDPNQRGVAGARLYLRSPDAKPGEAAPGSRDGQTDENGRCVFRGLREGAYRLSSPSLSEPMTVTVAADAPGEVTVQLNPVGFAVVSVRRPDGTPNDEVAVSMVPVEGGPSGALGRAQGSGLYRLGPMPVGSYRVQVRDGVNPMAAVGEETPVEVLLNETTEVEVTYGGHEGRISGVVVDSEGNPLPGVWVTAAPDGQSDGFGEMLMPTTQASARRIITDSLGAFEVPELDPNGSFVVIAERSLGGQTRVHNVKVGQDVRIQIQDTGSLSGVVVGTDGQPVPAFNLIVTNREAAQTVARAFVDPSGRWRVDDVAPGRVQVAATVATTGEVGQTSTPLGAGQTVQDLRLELTASQ